MLDVFSHVGGFALAALAGGAFGVVVCGGVSAWPQVWSAVVVAALEWKRFADFIG